MAASKTRLGRRPARDAAGPVTTGTGIQFKLIAASFPGEDGDAGLGASAFVVRPSIRPQTSTASTARAYSQQAVATTAAAIHMPKGFLPSRRCCCGGGCCGRCRDRSLADAGTSSVDASSCGDCCGTSAASPTVLAYQS